MRLLQQHLHGQSEVVFRDPILLDMSAQQMIQPFVPHMLLIRMCEGDFFFFPSSLLKEVSNRWKVQYLCNQTTLSCHEAVCVVAQKT